MQYNPFLGKDTYGHMACHGPELVYIIHRDLRRLEEKQWLTKPNKYPHFEQFRTALKGLQDKGKYGRRYFMKAVQNFLERFRYVWEKHMASKYRSSRLVWYMLGGDPHLASEFARWIVDFDERLVDEGEESSGVLPGFVFTRRGKQCN